jgi:hypothetical protein
MKNIPIDLRILALKTFCVGLFSAGILIIVNTMLTIFLGNGIWVLLIKILFWIALAIGDSYILLLCMKSFLKKNTIWKIELDLQENGPAHTHAMPDPMMKDIIRLSKKLNGIEEKENKND